MNGGTVHKQASRTRGGLSLAGARSSLFGGRKNDTTTVLPTTIPTSGHSNQQQQQLIYQEQQENAMEEEIEQRAERLRYGVETIKNITIAIGDELKDQNKLLDDMHHNMSETQNSLQQALKKLNQLLQFSSTRHMCLLIVFVMVVFFVLYLFLKWSL
jgi:blocked-early-in-transport protein 1